MTRPSGRQPGAVSSLLYTALIAAWLARPGQADTYDVNVKLYTDPNCIYWADEPLLLDGGCYANIYSNNTKAFTLRIVYFNEPQRIDFREYTDDCYDLAAPKRTFIAGRCIFLAGSFWAEMSIRERGSTCSGPQCSPLAVVVQNFYSRGDCTGATYALYRYPVQSECLRWSNGTQTLTATSGDQNITLVDYYDSDNCMGGGAGSSRVYNIMNQYCYPLSAMQAPRSVMWRVQRDKPYQSAASAAYRPRLPGLPTLLTASAMSSAFTAVVPECLR